MSQLLTLHYDRCAKYYGSMGGQGIYGASSDEEKRLTMMLFSNIFDSLSKMVLISHELHLAIVFDNVTFVYIHLYRTTNLSSLERHYHVCRRSVVLCPRIILYRKITTTNFTVLNKISKDRRTDLIILSRLILISNIFFFQNAYCLHMYVYII